MKWEDDYEWWIRLFEGITITPDETKENQNKPNVSLVHSC